MNAKKIQLVIFGAVVIVVIFLALLFTCTIPGLKSCAEVEQRLEGAITFWGLDEENAYETANTSFAERFPGVEMAYRGFDSEETYESALLQALAAGDGPDIFMIPNRSLPRNIAKISAIPETRLSIVQLREAFPQIVEHDFVVQERIYALPVSIDTLALLYNRDLIDQAGVAIPTTWEEFQNAIPKVTKFSDGKRIKEAGAAIGTSNKNIEQGVDILNLLMLQTGTKMVSDDFLRAAFASTEGVDALRFYTQFSNGRSDVYTWNASMPSALDSFARGDAVMIFEYASAIPKIQERNNFINIGVAPVPQPQDAKIAVTYPEYWGYTVSKQSENPALAWEYILTLVGETENAKSYLQTKNLPPALRTLITGSYANDPDLHVFARQALTARSWPQANNIEIEKAFSNAIHLVNTNQRTPLKALQETAETVTDLMRKSVY